MASTELHDRTAAKNEGAKDLSGDPNMHRRQQKIMDYWGKYKNVMEKTGFASTKEVQETERWIQKTVLTDRREVLDSIVYREEFFEKHGKEIIDSGLAVQQKFNEYLKKAEPFLSKNSRERWITRFEDESSSVGFQKKRYWVENQFPYYVERWQKNALEREKLVKMKGFKDLLSYDSSFEVLVDSNREKFLDLHYDKRAGLIASAKAALLASEKMQLDLYASAQATLQSAASKNMIAHGKVGIWLHRIFKTNAKPKAIEAFVKGSGPHSLFSLMNRWQDVAQRYEHIVSAYQSGKQELPRGIHLFSSNQFLNLHFTQRLRYVEEMERRLGHGAGIEHEDPSFVKIRHAIDTKDWAEAGFLIADTKKKSLSEDDRNRLLSMQRYVTQFSTKMGDSETIDNADKAKHRIDELLHEVPSSLQPMILRLLRGPHANRSINQFRWIVYNNQWCRTHGYLNHERAMQGASEDHEAATKHLTEKGLDTGRHDSIGHQTAGQEYFRKKEFANHKATYLHINANSGAPNALAEWLEHEKDPKVLYWTTFCGHEDGMPMSDNWHNDLFHVLTEMRSHTKTIGNAGFVYHSPYEKLQSRH